MLDSFKNLLKKPEFPDAPNAETNFLAREEPEDTKDIESYEAPAKAEPEDSSEDAIPSEDMPSSRREKKTGAWPRTVAGLAACIGVACIGYYWYAASDAPRPADIPQGDILVSLAAAPTAAPPNAGNAASPPKISADVPKSPTMKPTAVQPPPETVPEKPILQAVAAESAAKKPSPGAFGANPFIDLSVLHSETSSASGLGLPAIYGNGNRALPEVPRPEVSPELLPSPGEIRTPAAPVGISAPPPAMGGLITKPNGDSIAIMGDGTVLSEGDTYKGDRRVTFIGGDGITFDDGNTVPFGQNK